MRDCLLPEGWQALRNTSRQSCKCFRAAPIVFLLQNPVTHRDAVCACSCTDLSVLVWLGQLDTMKNFKLWILFYMHTYTWACINTYRKTPKLGPAQRMSAHLENLWKLQGYRMIAAKVGRNLLLSHHSDRKQLMKNVRSEPPVWKAELTS